MGESKKRFLPWLEDQINSSHFYGVEWMNKDEKIFKLPWKHASKQNWKADDSQIFKQWAAVNDRFKEGDPPKWSEWKTNFRCALNKMVEKGDLEQMTTDENLKVPDPYRVFRFIQNKEIISDETENCFLETDQNVEKAEKVSFQGFNIPTFISEASKSFDCDGKDNCMNTDALTSSPQQTDNKNFCEDEESMETDECAAPDSSGNQPIICPVMTFDPAGEDLLANNTQVKTGLPPPEVSEFTVRIKYRNVLVVERRISSGGCCLFHGAPAEFTGTEIFDERNLERIPLPSCETPDPEQLRLTNKLLNSLDTGLLLWSYNNCIYAKRKCRSRIFVVPANSPSSQLIKLEKDSERVKIFDFVEFLECLRSYFKQETSSPPSAEVLIGVGQMWKPGDNPSNNLIISMSVFASQALHRLQKYCFADRSLPDSAELQISETDSCKYLNEISAILLQISKQEAGTN